MYLRLQFYYDIHIYTAFKHIKFWTNLQFKYIKKSNMACHDRQQAFNTHTPN